MTQQIKEQIERAAVEDTGGYYEQQAFARCIRHAIEHPELYGLVAMKVSESLWYETAKQIEAENAKLKHTMLELIEDGHVSQKGEWMISEALKGGK